MAGAGIGAEKSSGNARAIRNFIRSVSEWSAGPIPRAHVTEHAEGARIPASVSTRPVLARSPELGELGWREHAAHQQDRLDAVLDLARMRARQFAADGLDGGAIEGLLCEQPFQP